MNTSENSSINRTGASLTRSKRWLIVLAVSVLLVACLFCGGISTWCVVGHPSMPLPLPDLLPMGSISVGDPAPDFTLLDLNGQTVTLSSLRDNVVLINFWTTTCKPCLVELPYLQQLYTRYKDRGLIVLATAVYTVGSDAPIRAYVADQGYTFPVLLDSRGISRQYGVRGIPATFIVDAQGIVRHVQVGYGPGVDKALEEIIRPLLPRE